MYEIIMLNKFGEKITKNFDNEKAFKSFLSKAKNNKKIIILNYGKI